VVKTVNLASYGLGGLDSHVWHNQKEGDMKSNNERIKERMELFNVKFAEIFMEITSGMIHDGVDFDEILVDISFTYLKEGVKKAQGETSFEIHSLPPETH
jgi:hypothetical protein